MKAKEQAAKTYNLPKVHFQVCLPLNLYYHLQLSCGTNPYLKNEKYRREFSHMVPKDLYWNFQFIQDQYWFMQRFFIETLGRTRDLSSLKEGFSTGVEEYVERELIPALSEVLKSAYKAYELYWSKRYPELEKIEQEIRAIWKEHEEKVFAKIRELTKLQWVNDLYIVNIVDSLGYGGFISGDGHYAIGACEGKTFLHILIHELIHDNIKPAVCSVCEELELSCDQGEAIDETFVKLIEMEVTNSVVPWAEEPLEQKREEAKEEGFIDFFDAVLSDWLDYIKNISGYATVEAFMKEEALKRKQELERVRLHI